MQMVKNILIGLVLAWFVLLAFMPKQELYYKIEQALAKNDIIINEKEIKSGIFSLTLTGLDIYAKGIKLIKIDTVHIFTLLFYTKVDIEGIHIDESLKTMTPTEIDEATLTHAVWKPMVIDIDAKGAFGGVNGMMKIPDNTLRLDFNDTSTLSYLKPQLDKDEKGWYYETSF